MRPLVPTVLTCALAFGAAVGCAGGDDGDRAGDIARTASQRATATTPEPTTRGSDMPRKIAKSSDADASRRNGRRAAGGADQRRGKSSRNRPPEDLLAALRGSDVRKSSGTPSPQAQSPRALLKALRGDGRAGQSARGPDSGKAGLATELKTLLNGGGAPN
jgi:hypothetical protein